MRTRLIPYLLLFCLFCVCASLFRPLVNKSGLSARRFACQSNLKQIGLALQQYAQDYDERLPPRRWGPLLFPYSKGESLFQCPETSVAVGTSDYFFNSRFLRATTSKISSPHSLILMGDGRDDAAVDMTLFRLPDAWKKDEKSPAWRHLDGANYGFADGHVKWIKVNRVDRNFRVVKP